MNSLSVTMGSLACSPFLFGSAFFLGYLSPLPKTVVVEAQSVNLSVPKTITRKQEKERPLFEDYLFIKDRLIQVHTPLISDSTKTKDEILLDESGQESSRKIQERKTNKRKERGELERDRPLTRGPRE